jgi:hypothetical protein
MGRLDITKAAHDVRKEAVDAAQFLIAHNPQIDYQQKRPIDFGAINAHGAQPFDLKRFSPTDCSGSSISLIRCAGVRVLKDEKQRHALFAFKGIYDNGEGWTGSLGADLQHISRKEARPADFVLFPGHVVMLLQRPDKVDRSRPHLSFHPRDPLVESMGADADPSRFSLAMLDRYFPGGVVFLKTVPDDL